jgi:serine/threonine-protein kinase
MALGPGAVLAQKYRLEARIASGGMGSVWSAVDQQLDRRVAVKLIVESMSDLPDVRARFLREAQAAGKLTSPHVVQVLDYGLEGATPFMVLEWLEGEDLGRRIKQSGRLPVGEVATFLRQLGKGLRRAHDAGLVHRDIKPPNLFIARNDGDETLKILDFGIAKGAAVSGGDDTKTGIVVGSLRYMSPEQARGLRTVDQRADLWSVGVVLFHALTGALPFQGESDADLLVKLCTEQARTPSSIAPELAHLDPFFARVFDRDIEKRFQTIDDLVFEFHRAADLEPPRPRPPEAPRPLDGALAVESSANGSSRGGVTADPIQATLRGSSVSLRPRAPLGKWAVVGGALGATLAVGGLVMFVQGRGKDTASPPATVDESRGAAASPALPPSSPQVDAVGAASAVSTAAEVAATTAPSTAATAKERSAPPATAPAGAGRPATRPAAKRPAIPQNPY